MPFGFSFEASSSLQLRILIVHLLEEVIWGGVCFDDTADIASMVLVSKIGLERFHNTLIMKLKRTVPHTFC